MQKHDITYTFAVMIFNVEKFLRQTIESIIAQKGDDIEILLIDDGSTDSGSDICDEYACKDARIRVIHKPNGGVSSARNTAIDNAAGKWLIQVDGDDVILENAMDYIREYEDSDFDLLQFDAVEFIESPKLNDWQPKGETIVLNDSLRKEYHTQLIDHSCATVKFPIYNINPAWSKVWSMDFIRRNKLRYFTEVVKGEGTLFTFAASYLMKKVVMIPKPIYGYRLNPGSIMRRFSQNILDNQTVQIQTYQQVVAANGETENDNIKTALLKRSCYLLENAVSLGISHPDCNWGVAECFKWTKTLFGLTWVKEAADYAVTAGSTFKIYPMIANGRKNIFTFYCLLLRVRNIIQKKIRK